MIKCYKIFYNGATLPRFNSRKILVCCSR